MNLLILTMTIGIEEIGRMLVDTKLDSRALGNEELILRT